MNELLTLENIGYSFKNRGQHTQILTQITFGLKPGNILGISGESGSGKTTLAKIIAGIIKPTEGNISFNFRRKRKMKANPVQILFQNNGEILNPLREINKVVKEAAIISGDKNPDFKMEEIFRFVNFPSYLWKRKGYELSGGEQQRAALARILAVDPELLILDEPFSAQDPESQLNLLNLLLAINKKYNTTMICIAHNLKILRKLCSSIIIIYNGRIVESGNTEKILSFPEHPYTKFLLQSENYDLDYKSLNMKSNFEF